MPLVNTFLNRISLRLRLFLPLLIGIILAITLATVFLTRISIRAMNYELEQSLALEVQTIIKMFERERDLKIDQVNTACTRINPIPIITNPASLITLMTV